MPHAYEVMRDKFKSEGLPDAKAKEKAARIYNSKPSNKSHPVTNKPDKPKGGK